MPKKPPWGPSPRIALGAIQRFPSWRHGCAAEVFPPGGDDARPPPEELPSHTVPHTKDRTATAKAQRNFTDPDSRIMKAGTGLVQAYNAQAAVDSESQVIVAQALTTSRPTSNTFLRSSCASSRTSRACPRS